MEYTKGLNFRVKLNYDNQTTQQTLEIIKNYFNTLLKLNDNFNCLPLKGHERSDDLGIPR